jgi:16S rRNA (cytosine1402-N4)-methyltransferase
MRSKTPITTTTQLCRIIDKALKRPSKITGRHPAQRLFQALRIFVNDEVSRIDILVMYNDAILIMGF